ncbi:hypothetical protein CBR_g37130 [Chara braunii]|uniref:Uncharacterized protein n=1 Tax=Chara braunii TaxID=69332 RepID=A0A388LM56_CHABU|nr:hypothetical protein CBR_g37130 [Chara braunii]|eukprot:GBG83416.1 hypothetical protein CBR_g37130 [Chara braunii]
MCGLPGSTQGMVERVLCVDYLVQPKGWSVGTTLTLWSTCFIKDYLWTIWFNTGEVCGDHFVDHLFSKDYFWGCLVQPRAWS